MAEFFRTYPPPTVEIVSRISKFLLIHPDFYVKVLQLMDSLGLPVQYPDLQGSLSLQYPDQQAVCESQEESDVDDQWNSSKMTCESEEKFRLKARSNLKFARKSFRNDQLSSKNRSERAVLWNKRKNLKIQIFGQRHEPANHEIDCGKFGKFFSTPKPEDAVTQEAPFDFKNCFDLELIRKNRLSEKNRLNHKLFSGHVSGPASSRLYVKNVSKKIGENQLKNLFGSFVTDDDSRTAFDVRLMTSGKLRGQAFVSMGSVENARRAQEETNGFLFHEKPIVVTFARSRPV